jgi:restriction system protein
MPNILLIVGLPLLLGGLATAGWWVWRQRRLNAAALPSRVDGKGATALSDREFATLVTDAFQRQGYQLIGGGQRAGELTLRRDRETYLVQCRYRHVAKVGVEAVQALHRDIAARGASGGFVLTEGRFSREATAYAAGCSVRLLEGAALQGLLDQARSNRHGA